jgi:hypothetical protein
VTPFDVIKVRLQAQARSASASTGMVYIKVSVSIFFDLLTVKKMILLPATRTVSVLEFT